MSTSSTSSILTDFRPHLSSSRGDSISLSLNSYEHSCGEKLTPGIVFHLEDVCKLTRENALTPQIRPELPQNSSFELISNLMLGNASHCLLQYCTSNHSNDMRVQKIESWNEGGVSHKSCIWVEYSTRFLLAGETRSSAHSNFLAVHQIVC